MKYEELLSIVGGRPVFRSGLLRAGDVDAVDLGSQLSRWVRSGRLLQLRRGVYALPEQYRARAPHRFEVANLLVRPSYVSLESALAFRGLIPEAVFTTTSVTTARAGEYDTTLGTFGYQHIAPVSFWGYTAERLPGGAEAFIARPEKAFLDLVHLRPGGDDPAFLRSLRLEGAEAIDLDVLRSMALRWGRPKLVRAAEQVAGIIETARGEWEAL